MQNQRQAPPPRAKAAAEAKAILDAANEAAKNAEAKAAAKAAAEKEAAEKRAMAAGTAQSGSKGMPAGGALLLAIGVGLLAFAVYSFAEARWRRIDLSGVTN